MYMDVDEGLWTFSLYPVFRTRKQQQQQNGIVTRGKTGVEGHLVGSVG